MCTTRETLIRIGIFRLALTMSLLAAGSVLVWASRIGAEVLIIEDFETATTDSTGGISGWDGPADPSVMYITDKVSFDGKRSLELRYNPGSVGASFMSRKFPAQDQMFHRWYQMWSSGWLWDPISTKMVIYGPGLGYPQFYPEVLWGNGELSVQAQVIAEASFDSKNFFQSGTPIKFEANKWYCIEVKVKLNTPGKADGELWVWINGNQKMGYINREFRGDKPSDPAPSTAKIERLTISGSYGGTSKVPELQFSWHDSHVVSTDRVECLPEGVDKTPPSPPIGVRITTP